MRTEEQVGEGVYRQKRGYRGSVTRLRGLFSRVSVKYTRRGAGSVFVRRDPLATGHPTEKLHAGLRA